MGCDGGVPSSRQCHGLVWPFVYRRHVVRCTIPVFDCTVQHARVHGHGWKRQCPKTCGLEYGYLMLFIREGRHLLLKQHYVNDVSCICLCCCRYDEFYRQWCRWCQCSCQSGLISVRISGLATVRRALKMRTRYGPRTKTEACTTTLQSRVIESRLTTVFYSKWSRPLSVMLIKTCRSVPSAAVMSGHSSIRFMLV